MSLEVQNVYGLRVIDCSEMATSLYVYGVVNTWTKITDYSKFVLETDINL